MSNNVPMSVRGAFIEHKSEDQIINTAHWNCEQSGLSGRIEKEIVPLRIGMTQFLKAPQYVQTILRYRV